MASSFIGRIAVKSKSIGTTRRKIERNEMNAIVLYPTFRIRFELLKKMQERENNLKEELDDKDRQINSQEEQHKKDLERIAELEAMLKESRENK